MDFRARRRAPPSGMIETRFELSLALMDAVTCRSVSSARNPSSTSVPESVVCNDIGDEISATTVRLPLRDSQKSNSHDARMRLDQLPRCATGPPDRASATLKRVFWSAFSLPASVARGIFPSSTSGPPMVRVSCLSVLGMLGLLCGLFLWLGCFWWGISGLSSMCESFFHLRTCLVFSISNLRTYVIVI